MKNIPLVLISAAVGFAVAWVLATHEASIKNQASITTSKTNIATQPPHPVSPVSPFEATNDWQKFRAARERALSQNPDLAAEYKALLAEIDQQQEQLDDAMIQADPKVAPIVAT